jgi:hypothetical protein
LGVNHLDAVWATNNSRRRHTEEQTGFDHTGDGMDGSIECLWIGNPIKKTVEDDVTFVRDLGVTITQTQNRAGAKGAEAPYTQ